MSRKTRHANPTAKRSAPVLRIGLDAMRAALPAGVGSFDWHSLDIQLRLAQKLAALADADFGAYHQALRIWMGLIPRADRARLVMPFGLWDRLVPAGALAYVMPGYSSSAITADQARVPTSAASQPNGQMDQRDHILFELACGQRQWSPKPTARGAANG